MAGIVDNVATVTQAWWHYLRLGKTEIESALPSMEALRKLGDASFPALRRGIRKHDEPRIQLRSAVVLHWLGQPDGLPVLIDAIRYGSRMPHKDPVNNIVECYLLIGAPDATQALIGVWRQLPSLNDNDHTAKLICDIWRRLRDTNMLPTICESSVQTPGLFVETCTAFGVEAIPELGRLARDSDPDRRSMALRGLEQIPGYPSARIVGQMLQDCNAEVRSIAPRALEAVSGPVTTLNSLVEAHRAGFSTSVSVQMLTLYDPPELFALLAGLLTRYNPATGTGATTAFPTVIQADTIGAAREAALTFSRCPWPHAQVTQILCGLLTRNVDPSIQAAVAQTIAARGRANDDSDIQAYKAMWRQLTTVDREARAGAALALARLGEPLGQMLDALLDGGRPQGSILSKLHATLVNSQDVGLAMSEAVQHVATWFNRVSQVTAKRFASTVAESNPGDAALKDGRVPELLSKLLANVLDTLERNGSEEHTVEALSVGVATIRAVARLGVASPADADLRRAYTFVKNVSFANGNRAFSAGDRRAASDEIAGVLREAAGQSLIDLHGADSYVTLSAGLSHPDDSVIITSSWALGRLGDRRAVPLLQAIIDSGSPPAAAAARNAAATIRRGNPEMMTLLRSSSSADARTDSLLRPTTGVNEAIAPELLLRPANPGQTEYQTE